MYINSSLNSWKSPIHPNKERGKKKLSHRYYSEVSGGEIVDRGRWRRLSSPSSSSPWRRCSSWGSSEPTSRISVTSRGSHRTPRWRREETTSRSPLSATPLVINCHIWSIYSFMLLINSMHVWSIINSVYIYLVGTFLFHIQTSWEQYNLWYWLCINTLCFHQKNFVLLLTSTVRPNSLHIYDCTSHASHVYNVHYHINLVLAHIIN